MKYHISIVVPQKPNFELLAFKYFLLSLNPKLNTLEFSFADLDDYIFEEEKLRFSSALDKFEKAKKDIHFDASSEPDFIICLVSFSFDDDYFSHSEGNLSIITTDVWAKKFSPPSLFEYLVHIILAQILIMDTGLKPRKAHQETRGCILDYCDTKEHERIGILSGFVSDRVRKKVLEVPKEDHGEKFIKDMEYILGRSWIGTLDEPNSVAYNLKHAFNVNLFRDSGFTKTWYEKVFDTFYDIPQKAILLILGAIIGYFIPKAK